MFGDGSWGMGPESEQEEQEEQEDMGTVFYAQIEATKPTLISMLAYLRALEQTQPDYTFYPSDAGHCMGHDALLTALAPTIPQITPDMVTYQIWSFYVGERRFEGDRELGNWIETTTTVERFSPREARVSLECWLSTRVDSSTL